MRYLGALAFAASGLLAMQRASLATTFIAMPDIELAHSSDVIVLGQVQSISTAALTADRVETDLTLAVEVAVKGTLPEVITVAVPGGVHQDMRRVVFGAPHFYRGERVLLFLSQRPDGTLTTTALAMGKFTIVSTTSGDVARRQLGAGTVLAFDPRSGHLRPHPATDTRLLAPFVELLRQETANDPPSFDPSALPPPPAADPSPPASRWTAAFTFLGNPPARWIEPDHSAPVGFLIDPSGDTTLGAAASQEVVQNALAAWSGAGTTLQLLTAGAATPASFQACDGKSTIQFNDPFNEIGLPANCTGVLAVGGFCASQSETSTFGGVTFNRITEADITVNKGFADCAFWTATNLSEVLTHELGHSIGLGHSSENLQEPNPVLKDATMYYRAHFDGRGATLRSDDLAGLQALYPATLQFSDSDLVELRAVTLDPTTATFVVQALVHFPDGTSFVPSRDSVTIQLTDSGGLQYTGTVARWSLGRSRTRPQYVGTLNGTSGTGSAAFTWIHGSAGTFVLRANSASFAHATGSATVLSVTFGSQTSVQPLPLQQAADGTWNLS